MTQSNSINIGGFVDPSFSDYEGVASLVIFTRGCTVGCQYCQNKYLQSGESMMSCGDVKDKIDRTLCRAIVFSGGEPLQQAAPLLELVKHARSRGKLVSIQTSGIFSIHDSLVAGMVLDLADKILLDIKDYTGPRFVQNWADVIYNTFPEKTQLRVTSGPGVSELFLDRISKRYPGIRIVNAE
mgnify:CR=1 FL=1